MGAIKADGVVNVDSKLQEDVEFESIPPHVALKKTDLKMFM